ncbi:hypothetical protein BJX65DRAFT_302685 [Aspergillus insuetus]
MSPPLFLLVLRSFFLLSYTTTSSTFVSHTMSPATQLLLTTYQSPSQQSSSSPPTVALILALAISIQTAVSHGANLPIPIAQYGTVAISAWTQFLSAVDILILRRVTYEEHVDWRTLTPSQRSIWHAICFALCLPNNTRLLGIKRQINHVHSFYDCTGPIPTPSRAKFLRMRTCTLISSLLVAALGLVCTTTCSASSRSWPVLGTRATLATVLNQTPSDLLHPASLTKSPRVQFYLYALFLGSIFLLHKIGYTLYSLVAVGLNFSPPEHWPSFYGASSEAWTMRRFWGNFRRQVFCSFLDSNVNFVVSLLGLRRQSLVSRYTRYIICFLISGFLHLALDHALGIRGSHLLSVMITFLLQPIAFAIEDLKASAIHLGGGLHLLELAVLGFSAFETGDFAGCLGRIQP